MAHGRLPSGLQQAQDRLQASIADAHEGCWGSVWPRCWCCGQCSPESSLGACPPALHCSPAKKGTCGHTTALSGKLVLEPARAGNAQGELSSQGPLMYSDPKPQTNWPRHVHLCTPHCLFLVFFKNIQMFTKPKKKTPGLTPD